MQPPARRGMVRPLGRHLPARQGRLLGRGLLGWRAHLHAAGLPGLAARHALQEHAAPAACDEAPSPRRRYTPRRRRVVAVCWIGAPVVRCFCWVGWVGHPCVVHAGAPPPAAAAATHAWCRRCPSSERGAPGSTLRDGAGVGRGGARWGSAWAPWGRRGRIVGRRRGLADSDWRPGSPAARRPQTARAGALRTCGVAPAGPVTFTAFVRPSPAVSTSNSTSSSSRRLRKPSDWMLVCGGKETTRYVGRGPLRAGLLADLGARVWARTGQPGAPEPALLA